MIGALWTGISGLSTHQDAINNESNNIANVNTAGYKASRISFADQMYQDRVGKGSKVLEAEKIYEQGNLQLTGVSYDMALSGNGFFPVKNMVKTGTSETYYTRAGNFRMGDNGTLQDANSGEVQGWAMRPVDADTDVTSTNPNIKVFTKQYGKLAANQIVKFPDKVQTYTAKMTDYTKTAKADGLKEFNGAGYKTQSSKISDVEALITDYQRWLTDYASDPESISTPSVTQAAVIDFPNPSGSIISKEGDQVFVYIDGNKISQNFIEVTTTYDLNGDGKVDREDHIQASRNATYKSLADKISNITGLVAYTVDQNLTKGTDDATVTQGRILIKGLIPGKPFDIGDVAESSGSATNPGFKNLIREAQKGKGEAAVEASMLALRDAVAGKQRDLYKIEDIYADDDGNPKKEAGTLTFSMNDIELKTEGGGSQFGNMVQLAQKINESDLQSDIKADIINGNLVIESKIPGKEFNGILSYNDGTNTYTKNTNPEYSINSGGGADFLQIINTIDQTSSHRSLQLRLDTLDVSDSAFGEFKVDHTGLITMKQDGAEFAIGQVAIAQFNDNRGLNPMGNNLLSKTNRSGEPLYNINNNKTAKIEARTLELSTADLSKSLVNLMVYQRAFEANAKSITTADQLLNTLINLKR
jgi:flagellar hook protein FlgE